MSKTDNTRPYKVQLRDVPAGGYYRLHRRYDISLVIGGQNYLGGAHRIERKFRRRKFRQRERLSLQRVKSLGFTEEYDFLPRREDRRTVYYDLD